MTGNEPRDGRDDPLKDEAELPDENNLVSDESGGSDDEPDLLFANINALMGGSEAPAADPVNLDDYPYSGDEEPDLPLEGADDSFIPVDEPDDPFRESTAPDEGIGAMHEEPGELPVENELPVADGADFYEEPRSAAIPVPGIDTSAPRPERHEEIIELGFYGKLPTYGDFIQKRLPRDFTNPWHEWIQAGLHVCRERDPDGWLSYYLNCPTWSFVMSAGICGEQAVAGVTIPSVDRVGRYFNFTMASILPVGTDPAFFAGSRVHWFNGLENFAVSILEQEMDQDAIDQEIARLSVELSWGESPRSSFATGDGFSRVSSKDTDGVAELLPALLHHLVSANHEPYSLWWHGGSSQATAQLLSCTGMPTGDTYLDLIMDSDVRQVDQTTSKEPEVDYLDQLLSD